MSAEEEERRCPLWERLRRARRACARLCRRRRRRVAPDLAPGTNGRPPRTPFSLATASRWLNTMAKVKFQKDCRRKSSINLVNFNRFHFFDRSRESRRRINRAPPPQYSWAGERARTAAPPALACALFCGGARCAYERPHPTRAAVQGVYSDWITDDILAMARPSTAGIAARNIVQQFHSWGIRSLVNLQRAGEHASCGPPLTASGFTYDPDVFMANDIYYYNYAWPDYGEASLSGLLDVVKVLSFALAQGKVAVHCHAEFMVTPEGLGRTGVLIACYLVYSLRVRANDAIRLVRRRRPRSVQTAGQVLAVQQFEHYLLPQTLVFSSKEPLMLTGDKKSAEFTLRQHLHRQRAVLHGLDERAFKELPKIVYALCERLLQLCGSAQAPGMDFAVRSRPFYRGFLAYRLRRSRPPDPETPVDELATNEQACPHPMVEWRDPVEEGIDRNLESVSRITGGATGGGGALMPALHVYEAFVLDHNSLPEPRQRRLKQLRDEINMRQGAIAKIDEEEDPAVLSGLLLEWLETLKTPVLSRADLTQLVTHAHDPHACALRLDQEDIMLIEYLLRWVTRLRPLAANKKVELLRRLLASLTHQAVNVGGKCLPTGRNFSRLRDGTCSQVINFFLRMIVEIQKDMVKPGRDDNDVVVMTMPPKRYRINAWK